MDARIDELEHLMETEVELGEALVQAMSRKQQSIVSFQGEALQECTRREEDLLRPFRDLERERVRLATEIVGGPTAGISLSVNDLLQRLPAGDAVRISRHAARLRTVVERILHVNEQNRVLLQRSSRFVQETLRLVTDDHTRQFVDQKM